MKTILFQGDSITDASRVKENGAHLGIGYASKAAGKIGLEFPGDFEFLNRGISGNRVVDLYARIKSDIINLKPDYMSIMIGVNDVWHEINMQNGVDADKFEIIYDMLISDVIKALPDIKIMIIEPYVLPESATVGELEDGRDKYEVFRSEVLKRAEVSKRIADKYNLVFLPLQQKLDELTKIQPAVYWVYDGVHPSNIGHEFIANEWVKCFKENF